jgi:glucans biosynthesis protein
VHFGGAGLAQPPGAWVAQSRRGHGYREAGVPGRALRPGHWQFHVDFVGPALAGLPADAVQAVASADGNARGLRTIVQPNPVTGGWRMTIDFERIDPARAVELRAYLRAGDRTLSETWALALPPE